jgi:serine/threonine protein phosphatase PrpC
MAKLFYAGESDMGYQRGVNEDFLYVKELDGITLAIVADGAGSTGTTFQPASIAALEVAHIVARLNKENHEAFIANAETFLAEAFRTAGRVLGAFQTANEELYNGYAASMACCIICGDELIFAHTGNTRINLLRKSKKTGVTQITLLTKDQTEGQVLLDRGEISFDEYHIRAERLKITGGLGVVAVPDVQTFRMPLRENDFVLMTTDGIHCAVRPDAFLELLRRCDTPHEGVKVLIAAAKELEYADNMTACLLWYAQEPSKAE